ncbi:MAG: 50S ribosomal protein L31 [Planctomycetota bacterium]|nr:MAG: 50S ribosomal protein L31 [Planctomycetota bacterium]
MKKGIHPEYMDCTVRCGCGATWQTRSTVPELKIEICSNCHPFYQGGGQRFVDTLGRVDRFTKKFGTDYFKQTKSKQAKKKRR